MRRRTRSHNLLHSLSSTLRTPKHSLKSLLVMMNLKLVKSTSSSSPSRYQKQRRTLELYVLEKRARECTIWATFSIELLKVLWHKEETLQTKMELVAKAFMEKTLTMSRFGIPIHTKVFSRWQTPAPIPMGLNSSFASKTLPISMRSTLFSVG